MLNNKCWFTILIPFIVYEAIEQCIDNRLIGDDETFTNGDISEMRDRLVMRIKYRMEKKTNKKIECKKFEAGVGFRYS